MRIVSSFFIALVLLVSVSSCNKNKVSKVPLPEGYYENEWEAPLAAASDHDRKIFVQFYADWCTLCASFKQEVLNDDEVELYMKDTFVPVLLDEEEGKGRELFEKHNLVGHPHSAIFDKNGELIATKRGKMSKEDFLDWVGQYE